MQSEIVKTPKMKELHSQQQQSLYAINNSTTTSTSYLEVSSSSAANGGSIHIQTNHSESRALLSRYQQYLDYKMKRIFLVKQILLDIIKIYESLVPQSHLRVQDIQLLIFLLDTIEYLNNYSLIKKFWLQVQPYPAHLQLNLPDVVIKPQKLHSTHRSRMEQLKVHYFKKIDLINQKFLESIQKRTNILLQQFAGQNNFKTLENLIQEIASLVFPKAESVKEVYYLYLQNMKRKIETEARANLPLEELTLFYLWQHLIRFHSFEEDTKYGQEDYLKTVRTNLFCSSREHMFDHLFKVSSSQTLQGQAKAYDWK